MPIVQNGLERNYQLSKSREFVPGMIFAIRDQFSRVVRIHSSGDFYNARYTRKWVKIVEACPDVVFYTYTRNWRVADYLPPLLDLAALPNLHLWASCDRDTGLPPARLGLRTCWLMADDTDHPPQHVDLVFREVRTTVMTFARHRSPVCLHETGKDKRDCSHCRRCFAGRKGKQGVCLTLPTVRS